jgi:hypothetical protein
LSGIEERVDVMNDEKAFESLKSELMRLQSDIAHEANELAAIGNTKTKEIEVAELRLANLVKQEKEQRSEADLFIERSLLEKTQHMQLEVYI